MENKKCKMCLNEYSLDNFYKHNRTKDGLHNECKNCIKEKSRLYHKENSYKISIKQKVYRKNNRDYFNAKSKEWKKRTGYDSNYLNNRLKTDDFFRFKNRLRNLIRISVKKGSSVKKSKSFEILGCNYDFFIKHIEKKFTLGMSWSNHGLWHLDHIIPISSAKNENDVIKLNHYLNFQPLWAKDNLKKYNKINETFNPQENDKV
jgi:hypothetical protein